MFTQLVVLQLTSSTETQNKLGFPLRSKLVMAVLLLFLRSKLLSVEELLPLAQKPPK